MCMCVCEGVLPPFFLFSFCSFLLFSPAPRFLLSTGELWNNLRLVGFFTHSNFQLNGTSVWEKEDLPWLPRQLSLWKEGGGGTLREERKKKRRSPTAFIDRIRLWWNIIPARQTAAGPVLFFVSLSLLPSFFTSSTLSHSLYHLSFHFQPSPTVCLFVCIGSFLAHTLIFPSPSLFLFPSPSFSPSLTLHAAASSEKSVWNLPPIRGLNPPVQPSAAHPWQLFRCLRRLIHHAEAHLTLPGNWSLFRTGRDKYASPSTSKCKLNGSSLSLS